MRDLGWPWPFSGSASDPPPAAPPRVEVALATRRGLERSRNQDLVIHVPDLDLVLLADGMGGGFRGDLAARMAAGLVRLEVSRAAPGEDPGRVLRQAIECANREIHHERGSRAAGECMGTTLTALWLRFPDPLLAHVGDSRAWRIRGRALRQLTTDHTVANEAEQLTRWFPGHLLTRAVGTEPEVDVEVRALDAAPGDVFLLTSDGLHRGLEPRTAVAIARREQEASALCEVLFRAVPEAPDDASLAVVRIGRGPRAPAV